MLRAEVTRDEYGVPGILARTPEELFWGLGLAHAKLRPTQTLLLHTLARGSLSERILPLPALESLDRIAHRLNLVRHAEQAVARLSDEAMGRLTAYLAGMSAGLARAARPWHQRLLGIRWVHPDPVSALGAVALAGYLGLAESQERMERLLVGCLQAGADAGLLEELFGPALQGWEPEAIRGAMGSHQPFHGPASTGSNAWAVAGGRSSSGYPLLAGDPHLEIGQLPALLMEVRGRWSDGFLLGASIPGLPCVAVGRNKHVGWAGTYACADNVDLTLAATMHGAVVSEPRLAMDTRISRMRRRFLGTRRVEFVELNGWLFDRLADGRWSLGSRWAGVSGMADSLEMMVRMPFVTSAQEAEKLASRPGAMSLHFVLADRSGDVRVRQSGSVPKRRAHWSGLYPRLWTTEEGPWESEIRRPLPSRGVRDGIAVSANEASFFANGDAVATLPQPGYRLTRIEELIRAQPKHDVHSMAKIQLDVLSSQGLMLRPMICANLDAGPLKRALLAWDGRCDVDSVGAHAFNMAYRACWQGLAAGLGGDFFKHALLKSEVQVWWADAVDRFLALESSWRGPWGEHLRKALHAIANQEPQPWGAVQTLTLKHVLLGHIGLPGTQLGPFPLPGSTTTVRQGTVYDCEATHVTVGAAFRFLCDLGDSTAWVASPGQADERASSTACLDGWRQGAFRCVRPPDESERA